MGLSGFAQHTIIAHAYSGYRPDRDQANLRLLYYECFPTEMNLDRTSKLIAGTASSACWFRKLYFLYIIYSIVPESWLHGASSNTAAYARFLLIMGSTIEPALYKFA